MATGDEKIEWLVIIIPQHYFHIRLHDNQEEAPPWEASKISATQTTKTKLLKVAFTQTEKKSWSWEALLLHENYNENYLESLPEEDQVGQEDQVG